MSSNEQGPKASRNARARWAGPAEQPEVTGHQLSNDRAANRLDDDVEIDVMLEDLYHLEMERVSESDLAELAVDLPPVERTATNTGPNPIVGDDTSS